MPRGSIGHLPPVRSVAFPRTKGGRLAREHDVRLYAIAAKQHGVLSRRQAIANGTSDRAIARLLAHGTWRRLYPGVYVHEATPVTWRQQLAGALLACGPTAIASHRAAAMVWSFVEDVFVPEVTVPAPVRRAVGGVVVHRSRHIERAVRDGFRVTRPLRTLLDLAGCVTEEQLESAVNAAHRIGLIDPARLKGYLDEPSNLNSLGSRFLREIAASMSEHPNDGELETLFYSALRRSRLPLPVAQHPVTTQEGPRFVDYAYPDRAIAIELDSWKHHGSRTAFEVDRARRNELELLGWHVLQFTWRQLRNDPVGVALTIGRALGLRPVRWPSA